jgi:hypothetical protein
MCLWVLLCERQREALLLRGRSKDLSRRLQEHRSKKRTGHEDKYEFIRKLEAKGVAWHCEVIETLSGTEYASDAERWHVIRLTREGHELMNMRHGSVERREELAEQVRARHIRNAADVRADRERRAFEGSRRLRRRIRRAWISVLKECGIPDVTADTVLPPIFKRRLLAQAHADGDGNCSVAPGWKPDEFISWLRRPLSKIREFRRWCDSLNLPPLPK